MQMLKRHPFEDEIDQVIRDLGGDLAQMKQADSTGTMYRALFGSHLLYLALPTYVPGRNDNFLRIEITVGQIAAAEVPQLLLAISKDFDVSEHCPLRVIPRTKDHKAEVLLQCVASADLVKQGFIASTVIWGIELAQRYREEFLGQKEAA